MNVAYKKWIDSNRMVYARYFCVVGVVLMLLMIPFDFFFFDRSIYYAKFHLGLAGCFFGWCLWIIFLTRKREYLRNGAILVRCSVLIPALAVNVVYVFFLLNPVSDELGILLVANYMVGFFSAFFFFRFRLEQGAVTFFCVVFTSTAAWLRPELRVRLVQLDVFYLSLGLVLTLFRREFVMSLFSQHRASQLLQERQELEVRHSQEMYDLATQLAHDIRSPVAALRVFCMTFKGVGPEGEMLRSAIDRVQSIADGLLETRRRLSIADSGSPVSDSEDAYPRTFVDLIQSVVLEKQYEYKDRPDIRISFELVGNEVRGLSGRIESVEFQRVISNLINNSIEALDAAGVVKVVLRKQQDFVEIQIMDNGRGISPEMLTQLEGEGGTFQKVSGLGLGMSHAKKCVQRWNGRMVVSSVVREGTTVRIMLPCLQNIPQSGIPGV